MCSYKYLKPIDINKFTYSLPFKKIYEFVNVISRVQAGVKNREDLLMVSVLSSMIHEFDSIKAKGKDI